MIEKLRRECGRPLLLAALILIPLGIFMFVGAITVTMLSESADGLQTVVVGAWIFAAVYIFGVIGLLIRRWIVRYSFDPNGYRLTEERFAIAAKFAMTIEQLRRIKLATDATNEN
jgi:hypothetical protein